MAKKAAQSTKTKTAGAAKTKTKKTAARKSGAAKGKSKSTPKPVPTLAYEEIAARAEAIWREKGCPAGQDEQNWHEAERQLKSELGIQ